jgi:hypothetical protein
MYAMEGRPRPRSRSGWVVLFALSLSGLILPARMATVSAQSAPSAGLPRNCDDRTAPGQIRLTRCFAELVDLGRGLESVELLLRWMTIEAAQPDGTAVATDTAENLADRLLKAGRTADASRLQVQAVDVRAARVRGTRVNTTLENLPPKERFVLEGLLNKVDFGERNQFWSTDESKLVAHAASLSRLGRIRIVEERVADALTAFDAAETLILKKGVDLDSRRRQRIAAVPDLFADQIRALWRSSPTNVEALRRALVSFQHLHGQASAVALQQAAVRLRQSKAMDQKMRSHQDALQVFERSELELKRAVDLKDTEASAKHRAEMGRNLTVAIAADKDITRAVPEYTRLADHLPTSRLFSSRMRSSLSLPTCRRQAR